HSTLKGDKLAERVLELLHLMDVEDWSEVQDYHQLKLDRISGAMTNCIFLVSDPPRPRKVLLRVYGIGLDALFSREKELYWLQNLSTMDIGPSLLGIFKNGRFEQYVESTTLTKDDIRDPRTSRHIAHRMCELHNIVNIFPPPEGTIPQSQENIARWVPLAKDAIEKICARDPSKRAVIDEFDFGKLMTEIEEVQRELMSVHSPIVFAHNDAQYGNILKSLDEDGELVVIDFEYAGYNTRGFDIGNHFCEWTADYHSERPSILHHDKYPTKAEQLNFLEAYMEAEIAIGGASKAEILDSMYKEVNKFALTSHIMWGLWGLIQATQSEIEFDYLEYALQRLYEFR
ncbi:kinase-like protein, partial [Linnemannia elongata AG-77]